MRIHPPAAHFLSFVQRMWLLSCFLGWLIAPSLFANAKPDPNAETVAKLVADIERLKQFGPNAVQAARLADQLVALQKVTHGPQSQPVAEALEVAYLAYYSAEDPLRMLSAIEDLRSCYRALHGEDSWREKWIVLRRIEYEWMLTQRSRDDRIRYGAMNAEIQLGHIQDRLNASQLREAKAAIEAGKRDMMRLFEGCPLPGNSQWLYSRYLEYESKLAQKEDRLADALTLETQAFAIIAKTLGGVGWIPGWQLDRLAELHLEAGDLDSAELRLRQALDSRRQVETTASYAYHKTLVNLAVTLLRKGERGAAKAVADEFLQFAEGASATPEQKIDLFSAAGNLALQSGRYDEAIRLCQKALQIVSTRADWTNSDRHFHPAANLAHANYHLRHHDQAIEQYQKLLDWSIKNQKPQTRRSIQLWLANCYLQKNQLDLAEKAMNQAVELGVLRLQATQSDFQTYEIGRQTLFDRRLLLAYQARDFDQLESLLKRRHQELEAGGKAHTFEAQQIRHDLEMIPRIKALSEQDYARWREAKDSLVAVLNSSLRPEDVISKAEAAETSFKTLGFEDDMPLSLLAAKRGIALASMGQIKAAIPALRQATDMFEKQWSDSEPPLIVASTWLELGKALRTQQSELPKAIMCLQRASQLAERMSASTTYRSSGVSAGIHADALHALADAQRWNGQFDAAETNVTALIELRRRVNGPISNRMLGALRLQAEITFARAYVEQAATQYLAILELHKKLGSPESVKGTDYAGIGMALASMQRHAEAEEHLRTAIQLLETHEKNNYWTVGRCYRFLGDVCSQTNRLDDAERHYLKVMTIWESVPGLLPGFLASVRESLVGVYYQQAFALEQQGKPAQAIEFRRKAKPLLVASGGEKSEFSLWCEAWIRSDETWSKLPEAASQEVHRCVTEMIHLESLTRQNRFTEVVEPLLKLASQFEQHLGPNDARTFLAWRMRAESLVRARQFPEGLASIEKALAANRAIKGRDDSTSGTLYFLQGDALWSMGRIGEAADAYLGSCRLLSDAGASSQMNYAAALLQFARCRMEEDRAVEVVTTVRHATNILRSFARQRPDLYVGALASSAKLSTRLGDTHLADLYLQEAERLLDGSKLRGQTIEAVLLDAKTFALTGAGRYDDADQESRRWLELANKRWQADAPSRRLALRARALTLCRNGQLDLALPIAQQVLESAKASPGEEIAAVGQSLLLLGEVQMGAGDVASALNSTRQALVEMEKAIRPGHERLMAAREQLARLEWSQGNEPAARAARLQNLSDAGVRFEQLATVATSDQTLSLAQTMRQTLYDVLSLPIDPATNVAIYEEVLRWKGAAFLKQLSLREAMRDPKNAALVRQWQQAASTLATNALRPPYTEGVPAWLEQLSMQRLELGRLDSLMSQFAKPLRAVKATDIQTALLDNQVLIDVVAYPYVAPDPNARGKWLQNQRYALFVVTKNQDVRRMDIVDGDKLTRLVEEWRELLDVSGHAEPDVCLNEGLPKLKLLGSQLRDLVWTPLAEHTNGKSLVILSPDSALTSLPFGALPGSDPHKFLIEEKAFMVIPAARLLVERSANVPHDPSLLVFGQVDYGSRPGERPGAPSSAKVVLGGFSQLTDDHVECGAVIENFGKRFAEAKHEYVIKDSATEARFRALANQHRWIHVSTHGFFQETFTLQNLMSRMLPPLPGLGDAPPQLTSAYGLGTLGHPGLQCGIGLAGANVPNQPGEDDGILSALEVSMMDLSSVDGVVLSACQTALGTIRDGEGVLGLQRAFHQAGARSVIATLWSVPVVETIQLLNAYYAVRWQGNADAAMALQQAQAAFIQQARRDEEDSLPAYNEHPFFWAGFSLSAHGVDR